MCHECSAQWRFGILNNTFLWDYSHQAPPVCPFFPLNSIWAKITCLEQLLVAQKGQIGGAVSKTSVNTQRKSILRELLLISLVSKNWFTLTTLYTISFLYQVKVHSLKICQSCDNGISCHYVWKKKHFSIHEIWKQIRLLKAVYDQW